MKISLFKLQSIVSKKKEKGSHGVTLSTNQHVGLASLLFDDIVKLEAQVIYYCYISNFVERAPV